MPNINQVWNEETEKALIEENLYSLQKFLNNLNQDDNWENPHTYEIIEYNPKENEDPFLYTPNRYKLVNLKIDSIQDGTVMFDDGEGILMEAMYNNTPFPLHHICIDNILMVGHIDNIITISTSFGFIKIIY